MTEALEIRLLGPFEALVDGRPVSVAGSKREALLALLALRRGSLVAVDALIDALWGEDLPAGPRNALQHHVMRIRAALGPQAISSTAEGYALGHATVDALDFEDRLAAARRSLRQGDARGAADETARALQLWRGAALQGLPDTATLTAEARRLQSLRVDALEEACEAALALGERAELVPTIRQALAEAPFRERLWGQLMLALYRSGRQADALDAFQEARQVLSEELGLVPGPELQRLQAAILEHDAAIAPVPVPARRQGNLPAPLTTFVGRDGELDRVVALLGEARLVTITGLPGVGKSRLALEAARVLEQEAADGAWLADLERAAGPDDVSRLVADALDVADDERLERVVGRLRDATAIVVLDGCERVVDEARRIASTLLAACPDVRVLATSREPFRLPGETRLALEPLALPEAGSVDGATAPAVALFLERARAARAGFDAKGDSAELAIQICRRVDGLPLAIELAAARVNALGLSEILSSLDRRFAALETEGGLRPEENRALETLVAWSYDLLHADEKTLLHHLALHRGGASLPALSTQAAEHGLDQATTTQLIGLLVDKSIVTVSFPGGNARYELLDTVREYVLRALEQSGGLAAASRSHAAYFLSLAELAREELRGADWLACLELAQLENENLWAALTYAREARDGAAALRLGAALGWYFALAERISEGRRYLQLALDAAPDDASDDLRAELLAFLGYLASEEFDLEAAADAGERALALAGGDAAPEAAIAKVALASAFGRAGDREKSSELARQARAAFEELADHWGAAAACLVDAIAAAAAGDVADAESSASGAILHSEAIGYTAFLPAAALLEAWVAERRGDLEAAGCAYSRGLELSEQVGLADHGAFALVGLGSIAQANGDLAAAEDLQRRALTLADAASEAWLAAYARVRLGRVLEAQGDPETAVTLYRAALESAERPRPFRARESLFFALAGDPAEAARAALAAAV